MTGPPRAGADVEHERQLDPQLAIFALARLNEVRPGDDLAAALAGVCPADLADDDVLVVAHKVVSKAEGRLRHLDEIEPGARARELAASAAGGGRSGGGGGKDARLVQAILDESREVLRAARGVLVCETHHGLVCANAGVDRSNTGAAGELVLLPADPDASARALRAGIALARGVRPAVVVADSFGRPWRLGQTDVAVGAAGLVPLDDWRGRHDAAGRELRATELAVADSVAAAADLARAKSSGRPAVLVRGLGRFVTHEDGPGAAALRRPRTEDLFR